MVLGKYPARGKILCLNSLWRHSCNYEWLGFRLSTNDKVKKIGRRQCQPLNLLQNFDFYTANLKGVKNTERFLGSNLQCCLHATVLLAIKYLAELNKYILLVRVIWEKYRLRGEANLPVLKTSIFHEYPSLTGYICVEVFSEHIHNTKKDIFISRNCDTKQYISSKIPKLLIVHV